MTGAGFTLGTAEIPGNLKLGKLLDAERLRPDSGPRVRQQHPRLLHRATSRHGRDRHALPRRQQPRDGHVHEPRAARGPGDARLLDVGRQPRRQGQERAGRHGRRSDVRPERLRLPVSVASATASMPRVAGLEGNITGLSIDNSGMTLGSATLSLNNGQGGSATLDSKGPLQFINPSITIADLSYHQGHLGFDGDLAFSTTSAWLKFGGSQRPQRQPDRRLRHDRPEGRGLRPVHPQRRLAEPPHRPVRDAHRHRDQRGHRCGRRSDPRGRDGDLLGEGPRHQLAV